MPASGTQERTTTPALTEEQRYIRDTLLGDRTATRPPTPPTSAARAVAAAHRGTFDVAAITARVKQVLDGPAQQGLVERLAKKASSDRPYANQILLDFQQSGISSADLDKVLRGLGPQYLSKLVRLLGDSFELRAYLAEKQVRWDLLYEYWEFTANDGFKFFSGFLVGAGKDAVEGVRMVVQLTQHLAKEEQRLLQAATAWISGDRARAEQILGERVEFYRNLLVGFGIFLEEGLRRLSDLSVDRVINYPMDWVYAKTREYNSLLLRREIYEAGVLIGEIASLLVGILLAPYGGYKLFIKIGKKVGQEVFGMLAYKAPTAQVRQALASLPTLTAAQVQQVIPYGSLKEFFFRIDSMLQRGASEVVRLLVGDRMWIVWQAEFGNLVPIAASAEGGTVGAGALMNQILDLGRDLARNQRDEPVAKLIERLDDRLVIHEPGRTIKGTGGPPGGVGSPKAGASGPLPLDRDVSAAEAAGKAAAPPQLWGRYRVGPAYASREEAIANLPHSESHLAHVTYKDAKGKIIATWWEASEKGTGLPDQVGHTEQKALVRVNLQPGETLEIRGFHPPCQFDSGCHMNMEDTAIQTGANIMYTGVSRNGNLVEFVYQGGEGHLPKGR
jgi:hypothetical protein